MAHWLGPPGRRPPWHFRPAHYPQYGYPFAIAFQLEYLVRTQGPQVTLTAKNVGRLQASLGSGYHPYFRVQPNVDAAKLTMPAETYLTNNDALIPIGRAAVAGTQYDFQAPKQIGTTKLDVCYTDLRRVDGVATATVETDGGHQIEVWADDRHKFMQVYTDDGAPGRPPAPASASNP